MSEVSQLHRRFPLLLLLLVALVLFFGAGCDQPKHVSTDTGPSLPDAEAVHYRDVVSDFYTGTIAMRVTDPDHPERYLTRASELEPDEPAIWANLGLYYLRTSKQIEKATICLEKAHSLAPNSTEIEALLGHLEDQQGHIPEAIAHFKQAVQLDPKNLHAHFTLSELIERQQDPNSDADYQAQMEAILKEQPNNLKALFELARIAAKRKDTATFQRVLQQLKVLSSTWPANPQLTETMKMALSSSDMIAANANLMRTHNLLKQSLIYRKSLSALTPDNNAIGIPMEHFLKLTTPSPTPAPPDPFTFKEDPIKGGENGKAAQALFLCLTPEVLPAVAQNFEKKPVFQGSNSLITADGHNVRITTNDKTITLPFPGGGSAAPPSPAGVLPVDLFYDFRMGLVLAGEGGLRIYRLDENGAFQDVTARSKLPAAILNARCYGVWAADVDLDGDLDLIVGLMEGGTLTLRNNGDGTFTPLHTFDEIKNLRGFLWADIDGDGAPDAAFLDAQGQAHIFMNMRAGQFVPRFLPEDFGAVAALGAGDVDRDGLLDFIMLKADGEIVRLSDKSEGHSWDTAELARWQGFSAPPIGSARLFIADMDNNGGLDIVASTPQGGQAWLSDEKGVFQPLEASPGASVTMIADIDGDGRLDLLALDAGGKAVQRINKSAPSPKGKNYHWMELRPRATNVARKQQAGDSNSFTQDASGDSRINSFGIGGEVEVRSSLLVQKQAITGPVVHFGLGENSDADYTRIVWPNGAVQGEFGFKASQQATVVQRLIGSCPWLFAWDGHKMNFVTDFLWRSPLGLRINAQDTAGVMTTEDWVKIRGDQLAPKDGVYDIRITAELWETHFFDLVSLMVVDHPVGSEVYVDERFAFPPPRCEVHATDPPHPILRAVDDHGTDVTDIVRERDGKYLDTFGRGQYQGITRDHYVEVEIPRDAAKTGGAVTLLANGWIHPTDSSINVAVSQGEHDPPHPLSLEIPNGKGGWVTVKPNLGFPSGKTKTILIDLSDVLPKEPANDPVYRLRLRTNLEVYWDCLQWTTLRPSTPLKTERMALKTAELRYRGFSAISQANPSSPELPDYDKIQAKTQVWRDLIGYCTRFGDVRELLQKVDDRYVIMNAGDELALQFEAPPPPPSGWVRDFVLIGDGWEKDGNYNTAFSKTVLPLPSHSRPNYNVPPGRLEDDPVYRQHPKDWEVYHTRYITPDAFRNALRPGPLH
ncbi:MAG TPA: FG-GAP-like repeat-containing protein [Chthonomonadaceae bacterium]|nr:FG-GAP-like repeat-containing protein [Chthonomonadaceae bacterium]